MRSLLAAALTLTLAAPAYAQLAPPDKNGLTFGQVTVNVRDVEATKKIMVDHFDGVAVQKNGITAVKWPGMLLVLNKAEPTAPSRGSVMDHFGFKVKSTQAIFDKWKAAGMEVENIFKGSEGFPNAYVVTPEGIRIELQEDTTMTKNVIGYHVHFLTPDYVKLLDWYVQTFNLEPFKRGTIATTANAPGMNFSFGNARAAAPPTKGRAIDRIGFEIDNLEAFCKQLEAKGVKFDIPYRVNAATGLKSAFLTDPNGTYIELTEGYDQY